MIDSWRRGAASGAVSPILSILETGVSEISALNRSN